MTYVITAACIDVIDGTCVKACPVDAIYDDHGIPEHFGDFVAINAGFFGPEATG